MVDVSQQHVDDVIATCIGILCVYIQKLKFSLEWIEKQEENIKKLIRSSRKTHEIKIYEKNRRCIVGG